MQFHWFQSYYFGHLQIPTKRIRQLDLSWRFALHLEQTRIRYKDGDDARMTRLLWQPCR